MTRKAAIGPKALFNRVMQSPEFRSLVESKTCCAGRRSTRVASLWIDAQRKQSPYLRRAVVALVPAFGNHFVAKEAVNAGRLPARVPSYAASFGRWRIERDRLIRRARQAETGSRMNRWLTSPGGQR